MVSDFIEERNGFLRIPESQPAENSNLAKTAMATGIVRSSLSTCVMPWK